METNYKTNEVPNKAKEVKISPNCINLFMQGLVRDTKRVIYGLDRFETIEAIKLTSVEELYRREAETMEEADNITTCICPSYEPHAPQE